MRLRLAELGHKKIYQNDFSWFLEFQGTIHRIESDTQYVVVDSEGDLCLTKKDKLIGANMEQLYFFLQAVLFGSICFGVYVLAYWMWRTGR